MFNNGWYLVNKSHLQRPPHCFRCRNVPRIQVMTYFILFLIYSNHFNNYAFNFLTYVL